MYAAVILLLMRSLLTVPPSGKVNFLPDSNPGAIDLPPWTAMAEKPGDAIVVLVIRHADKAVAATLDPPLSDAGRARAAALADALHDAGVTRILVDQSQRTQETAVPLSQREGLHPQVIPIDWNDPTSQVRAIADSVRRPGAVTLVIGHRNTVPAIIRALGGPPIPAIGNADYNDLYMIVLGPRSAAPVFVHATYGRIAF